MLLNLWINYLNSRKSFVNILSISSFDGKKEKKIMKLEYRRDES